MALTSLLVTGAVLAGSASIYLMNEEFATLIKHALDTAPENLSLAREELLTSGGLLWFPENVELKVKPGEKPAKLRALIWVVGFCDKNRENFLIPDDESIGNEVVVQGLLQEANFTEVLDSGTIPLQTLIVPKSDVQRLFVVVAHLLNQKLTSVDHRTTTSVGKTFSARKGLKLASSYNVVTLRRTTKPQEAREDSDREYSCRWLVRGHWRQQWYPATARLISPCLCLSMSKAQKINH